MVTKDPLVKAREDLERIVIDGNRTIKRAKRAIENIKKLKGGYTFSGNRKLSLNEKINYGIIDKIIGNYVKSVEVPGIRNHIKGLLLDGEITTNDELLSGYDKLDPSDEKKFGEVERKTLALYISYISH